MGGSKHCSNFKYTLPLQIENEAKLSKMVGLLIAVWLFAWTPYAILAIWAIFVDASQISSTVGLIPTMFCKLSAGVNVMLYGLR